MQHRTFKKESDRWSVTPVKVEKNKKRVEILQKRIVQARLTDQEGMRHPTVLAATDPRRLSRAIALVEPKPTVVLQEEQVSMFIKKDQKLRQTELVMLKQLIIFLFFFLHFPQDCALILIIEMTFLACNLSLTKIYLSCDDP